MEAMGIPPDKGRREAEVILRLELTQQAGVLVLPEALGLLIQ